MSKPRKSELVRCKHLTWRLAQRGGIWYADARSNAVNGGRHSLATSDLAEALQRLHDLDAAVATELGFAPPRQLSYDEHLPLSLIEGRRLYEDYIARPRAAAGVRPATRKRYRTVFDKFLKFANSTGITMWNGVTNQTLLAYASHLDRQNYASKTLRNELTTLIQAIHWLIREKHLTGTEPVSVPIRKVESQRAYCYTQEQIDAMLAHCSARPDLH